MNDSGKKVTTIPSNGHVNVAVKLTEGKTVAPVIAAVTDGGNTAGGGGGGGCDAGFAGGGALALGALLIAFKRFHS